MKILVNFTYLRRVLFWFTISCLLMIAGLQLYLYRYQYRSKGISVGVSMERLSNLFVILQDKENVYQEQLDYLDVPSFLKVVEARGYASFYQRYQNEVEFYTSIENDYLVPNEDFISHLIEKANFHTFENPVRSVPLSEVPAEQQILIVTAANDKYFRFLCDFIERLSYIGVYPKLIVYDLGLSSSSITQIKKTYKSFKIVFRKYSKLKAKMKLAHFEDPKIYAWKPIIIQDVFKNLKDGETFFYMDTAVILKTNLLQGLINYCREMSFVLPLTHHNFTCYTNEKMFDWFRVSAKSFARIDTHIHAAFLAITKNFLSTVILKAWVTCALDESCISPKGSRLAPCCGCHRYDQSALQIILTHFYFMPANTKFYHPAYGKDIRNSLIFDFVSHRP